MENLGFGRGHGRNFDHLTMVMLRFWPWSWSKIFDHMTMTPGRRPNGQKIMVALPPPPEFMRLYTGIFIDISSSTYQDILIFNTFADLTNFTTWTSLPTKTEISDWPTSRRNILEVIRVIVEMRSIFLTLLDRSTKSN